MVDEDRLNKLKDILDKDPDSPLFTQYADLLRKSDRIDEAITILENGIRKHPNNSIAYLILGRCFSDKGAMEAAIQNYEHASELEPQNILAHKELGNAYISVGEKSKALITLKKVFKMDNSDIEVKKIIDELSAEESKKSVDEDIGSMTEKGDFFSFFDNSVNIEKKKPVGEAEEAQKGPEKSQEVKKTERPEWLSVEIAKVYMEHDFKDKAIDILKRLQEFEPDNQEIVDLLKGLGVIEEKPEMEEKKAESPPEVSASQEFTDTFGETKEGPPEEKKATEENKHLSDAVSLNELFGDKEEPPKPPPEPPKVEKEETGETKDIGHFKSWLDNLNK